MMDEIEEIIKIPEPDNKTEKIFYDFDLGYIQWLYKQKIESQKRSLSYKTFNLSLPEQFWGLDCNLLEQELHYEIRSFREKYDSTS